MEERAPGHHNSLHKGKRQLKRRVFITSLSACLCSAMAASAQNWPSFRGLNGSGVANGQDPPVTWDVRRSRNVAWRTAIPGLAHSSPLVWGERVFVTSAVSTAPKVPFIPRGAVAENVDTLKETARHAWRVYCLDRATGRILWQRTTHEGVPRVGRHPKSSQASATPATDGRHVIVYFGSEGLYCYDFAGKLIWKKDIGVVDAGSFLFPDQQYNAGTSPIIYKDLVILLCDRQQDSFIAAYDVTSGKEVWRTRRDEVPSWGTPLVYEGNARSELITNSSHIRAYDPLTGKEIWRLSPNSKTPIPSPVAGAGFVYVASGYPPAYPIYAIRPGGSGDISLKDGADSNQFVAWSKKYGGPSITTPLVYGEYLYTCASNGVVAAYDAATGARVYQHRLGNGTGFSASPIAADGKLYFASEDGDVYVVKAGSKFDLLATNRVGEVIMATPAITRGMVIVRTRAHVYAFGRSPIVNGPAER